MNRPEVVQCRACGPMHMKWPPAGTRCKRIRNLWVAVSQRGRATRRSSSRDDLKSHRPAGSSDDARQRFGAGSVFAVCLEKPIVAGRDTGFCMGVVLKRHCPANIILGVRSSEFPLCPKSRSAFIGCGIGRTASVALYRAALPRKELCCNRPHPSWPMRPLVDGLRQPRSTAADQLTWRKAMEKAEELVSA